MIKIRGKFTKENEMIFIGHLDLMRLFQRCFRRADIPVKYTEGYNPQPKLSLATALPLGVTSHGEYFDLELDRQIPIESFIEMTNKFLPKSIRIIKSQYTDDKKSIMSLIRWSSYIIKINLENTIDEDVLQKELDDFLNKDEIIITKTKKKRGKIKKRDVNIREFIKDFDIFSFDNNSVIFKVMLKTGSTGNLKPEDLIWAFNNYSNLDIIEDKTKIQRLELFIEEENNITTPI
ncbi:TIGR03936 family radical SAM-associated protein [Sporosalibacterium faouarense]|uniref:TIGR03936 family radical SAM-associated protein n=1 Tax=Sporosalibacterium faouarense TaxID=516123 RepID=UPI00192B740B|nr:TIGR03936 family radical SAM-associated protein [Sporosalibacterium faouarense]